MRVQLGRFLGNTKLGFFFHPTIGRCNVPLGLNKFHFARLTNWALLRHSVERAFELHPRSPIYLAGFVVPTSASTPVV